MTSPAEEGDVVLEHQWEGDEISGATQYAWGVWTRWLTVYPDWL